MAGRMKQKEKFSSRFERSEYEEKRWQGEKGRSLRIVDEVSEDDDEAAALALREVADSLAKTSKVIAAGLQQANSQGQRLRASVARVERTREWSDAERRRAVDEVTAHFRELHESLKAREDEILREIKGVYDEQDQVTTRRLEELVTQGKTLSKACSAAQGLNEGSVQTTIQTLNSPVTTLLEALESTAAALQKDGALGGLSSPKGKDASHATGLDGKGISFMLCDNKSIQRELETLKVARYDNTILVGTPGAIEEAAKLRKLGLSPKHERGLENGPRIRRVQKEKPARSSSHRHTPTRSGRGASMASTASTSSNYTNRESTTEHHKSMSERSIEPLGSLPEDDKVFAEVPYTGAVKGVIDYLGTRQGTVKFDNPAYLDPTDPNVVVVRASSRIEGDLGSLTGYQHEDGAFFETESALSSWVSIELPIPLKISHYSLGYYIKGEEHVPRNWALQSSPDNATWTSLLLHENDKSLDVPPHVHTWKVAEEEESKPVRFFRVLQTGPTSSGTLFLVLSFLELYGTLYKDPK